jgi:hypothetical protein
MQAHAHQQWEDLNDAGTKESRRKHFLDKETVTRADTMRQEANYSWAYIFLSQQWLRIKKYRHYLIQEALDARIEKFLTVCKTR